MNYIRGRTVEKSPRLQTSTGMKSLSVKDPEAHRLAAAISQATGESISRVVTEALRERLNRLQGRKGKASVEELLAIAKRVSAQVKNRPYLDHGAFLYDDNGLPK